MNLLDDWPWIESRFNGPLAAAGDVDHAVERLQGAGLPLHPDRVKNWDAYLAVAAASRFCGRRSLVLDAGGCRDSSFLRCLARLGFNRLLSVNLDEPGATLDAIEYRNGDIEEIDLADASVGFLACLSVLEHGVNWPCFLEQAHRVLRPGGRLFISTDYWQTPMDGGGETAFGAPIRIFSQADVEAMASVARRIGFEPTGKIGTACGERVVSWAGLQFTFLNLLLRKRTNRREQRKRSQEKAFDF